MDSSPLPSYGMAISEPMFIDNEVAIITDINLAIAGRFNLYGTLTNYGGQIIGMATPAGQDNQKIGMLCNVYDVGPYHVHNAS
ncbi:hypothetical protein LPJ61_003609, partial [Coemansia biformis]